MSIMQRVKIVEVKEHIYPVSYQVILGLMIMFVEIKPHKKYFEVGFPYLFPTFSRTLLLTNLLK